VRLESIPESDSNLTLKQEANRRPLGGLSYMNTDTKLITHVLGTLADARAIYPQGTPVECVDGSVVCAQRYECATHPSNPVWPAIAVYGTVQPEYLLRPSSVLLEGTT